MTPAAPAAPSQPRSAVHWGWGLAFLLLIVAFVLVATFANVGALPPVGFYSSASQIIPVLIVALAVESRARDVWDNVPAIARWTLIGSLIVGESVAIVASSGVVALPLDEYVLAPDDPLVQGQPIVGPDITSSEIMAAITAGALAVGFLGVVIVALVRRTGTGNAP